MYCISSAPLAHPVYPDHPQLFLYVHPQHPQPSVYVQYIFGILRILIYNEHPQPTCYSLSTLTRLIIILNTQSIRYILSTRRPPAVLKEPQGPLLYSKNPQAPCCVLSALRPPVVF